ncbi:cysteine protease [Oleoguttula sp. CCFEE 5521]
MSLPSHDLDQLKHDVTQHEADLGAARTRDEALEIVIKAAETSMRALKLAKDPSQKTQLNTRVKQLLDEAEKIKTTRDWRNIAGHRAPDRVLVPPVPDVSDATRVRQLREPKNSRTITKKEHILLLKASVLNGFKFRPWTTPPTPDEFILPPGEEPFTDSAVLGLSDFQHEVFDGWRRAADALPPPAWFSGDRTDLGPSMRASRKIDVVQDAATDCSVVASICAGVARAERGHSKIMRQVLHPYDEESGRPMMSANGKYIVRLNFNGCYRKVVIDDRLPASNTSRVIHVVDRHNPGLLWPALLEKAYLKVRGGYDFPGSNSGTDLWILTGWIPEQVFMQSDDLEPDVFWRKTLAAFNYGDVMVTMGTGKISARAEREIGLAGEHDYAVIDMRDVDGQRLFLIKNPWCEGTSWRGRFKESKTKRTKQGENELALLSLLDDDDEPVQSTRDLLNADEQLSPGTFWMDLDNVIQYFESIYLNWNPGLFAHRQDVHFAWDHSDPAAAYGPFTSLRAHPQFAIKPQESGTVWVLLCRHFRNVDDGEDTGIRPHEIDINGFISLQSFSSNGCRVLLPDAVVEQSCFVDSPQILLKLDSCEAGKSVTVMPGAQELPPVYHTFTLSAFSNSAFAMQEASDSLPYSQTLSSAWTKDTAGGNAHSAAYSTNPQFSVSISQKSALSLLLESDNADHNVHLKLVHGKGQRVRSVRNRDIVVDSKDYRRRCCLAEIPQLDAGTYTIICSTFEPQQLSKFTLLVQSSVPAQVTLIPRAGAGRLSMPLRPARLSPDSTRLAAPLRPLRLVNLYGVARQFQTPSTAQQSPKSTSMLKLSIELGHGSRKEVLLVSSDDEFADGSAGGVQTPEIDLRPEMLRMGDLWLVLETMYAPQQLESFVVELFLDQPGGVEVGAWRSWDD